MTACFRMVVFAAFVFASMAAHAGRDEPLQASMNVDFPVIAGKVASADTAREAIRTAGARRGWVVVGDAPGQVSLRNNVRGKHLVVVKVIYDGRHMQVDYVSSENLNYRLTRGGVAHIHPKYHQWVGLLTQDILARLSR